MIFVRKNSKRFHPVGDVGGKDIISLGVGVDGIG